MCNGLIFSRKKENRGKKEEGKEGEQERRKEGRRDGGREGKKTVFININAQTPNHLSHTLKTNFSKIN